MIYFCLYRNCLKWRAVNFISNALTWEAYFVEFSAIFHTKRNLTRAQSSSVEIFGSNKVPTQWTTYAKYYVSFGNFVIESTFTLLWLTYVTQHFFSNKHKSSVYFAVLCHIFYIALSFQLCGRSDISFAIFTHFVWCQFWELGYFLRT